MNVGYDRAVPSENELHIERMNLSHFEIIKQFILNQHALMTHKEFFIIDDIDSELPSILANGIVIALLYGEDIVGIEALDVSKQNSDNLKTRIDSQYVDNKLLYELGWAMVRNDCRGRGYAIKLFEAIASFVHVSEEFVLVATVHPMNEISNRLCSRLGFVPVSHSDWFGYDRVFMIKDDGFSVPEHV